MLKIILCFLVLIYSTQCWAAWTLLDPLREPSGQGKYLSNIISQSPNPGLYSDPDLVTSGHENVHGVNSRLRQLAGSGTNGFYVLNNVGYIIQEPRNYKLSDVARTIPAKYRGESYNTYLVASRQWWENEPSYVFDEAVAYQAGTMVGLELGLIERAEDSFFRALELNIYSIYSTKLSGQQDMIELIRFITERNLLIYNTLPKNNPKVRQNYQYLLEVMRDN